jgi:CheY-like chemotaxis protein
MLEQLGYSVEKARDAEAALTLAEQQRFDLVVSDIVMPGAMDGLALATELRKRQPRLPVLLVTGYSRAEAKAAGDFVIMRKPIGLAELGRAAARAIPRSRQPQGSNVVRLREPRQGRAS